MEHRRTSFLLEKAPEQYKVLSGLKPFALIYAGVLAIAILLSLFVQWGIVEFFINLLMGWTLLSVPFMAVIIVAFDKEIKLPQEEESFPNPKKTLSYKFSMVWGCFLIVAGIVTLYFSNEYKKYYAFQCQTFFLEQPTGVYHIREDCKYIGIDEDDNYIENISVTKVKGVDVVGDGFSFCDACREWAEEAEMEFEANRYYRK